MALKKLYQPKSDGAIDIYNVSSGKDNVARHVGICTAD